MRLERGAEKNIGSILVAERRAIEGPSWRKTQEAGNCNPRRVEIKFCKWVCAPIRSHPGMTLLGTLLLVGKGVILLGGTWGGP
jgi:hypothetical protein